MLLILFDIHRNILSTQCTIQYSTLERATDIEIVLKPNNINLSIHYESTLSKKLNLNLPEDLFLPCTISSIDCKESVKWTINKEENFVKCVFPLVENNKMLNDEVIKTFIVTFRLQLLNTNATENCISRSTDFVNFKDFMKSKCEKSEMYDLICTNCGVSLTDQQISFQSVHDYFEGMSELSETWFCHKHDDHESFEPKIDSLYIGDMCFYFHNSVIKNLEVSERKREYQCVNCSSTLSLKKKMNYPNFIGFFWDKVMFQKLENNSNSCQDYKNNVALFSFYNLLEEVLKSAVSCKMYLQSKVEENTECLLLWVNSQKIAQFLLHAMNDEDIPNEAAFETKQVLKVLYCINPSDPELSKKWKHDFSVEFFQISDNMMNVIKELLENSSKRSLGDQETIKGFSFGYLPAYSFS